MGFPRLPGHALFLLTFVALLGLSGCSGDRASIDGASATSSTEPLADVSGAWTGRWLSRTGVGGATTSSFTQSGSAVDGEFHFTGSPCFSAARFKGTVEGSDVSGTATAGGIRVALSMSITGSSLDGTYTVLEGGACSSDTGTFTSKR